MNDEISNLKYNKIRRINAINSVLYYGLFWSKLFFLIPTHPQKSIFFFFIGVASIQANNNGSTKCIENDTDPKIASGLRYIKKLDRIIEQKNKKEKEIKSERQAIEKEFCLQIQKMIEEKGLVNFYGSQQLLALCMYDKNCDGYEDDVETVFTTQISSKFYDEKTLLNLNIEDTPASKSKQFNTSKNKNFIKRNIQLAARANEVVSLTDKEQERLDELLTDSNDLLLMNNPFSAPTISYDGGYNYSAEDQLALDIIDAKLMGMLPPGDFDVHPKINSCDVTLAKNKLDAATNKVGDTATFDILECGDNVLQKDHDNQFLKYRLKDIETQLENLKLTDKADKEAQIHPNLIRYLLNTEKKSVDNSI